MNKPALDKLRELLRSRSENSKKVTSRINPFSLETGFEPLDPYPPPATESEIQSFCESIGVDFTTDIKEWLKISNGPAGFFDINWAQKGCRIEEVWLDYPDWKRNGWVPIARDGFGNFYLKSVDRLRESPVCFVEALQSDKMAYAVASNALQFARF